MVAVGDSRVTPLIRGMFSDKWVANSKSVIDVLGLFFQYEYETLLYKTEQSRGINSRKAFSTHTQAMEDTCIKWNEIKDKW